MTLVLWNFVNKQNDNETAKKLFHGFLSRDRFLVEQPRRDSPAISPDLDRPADFCPSRVSTSGPASRD